jgi:hypothetical protein
MDTRILANWSKRFFDLPVCKDLPRLIKGVTVYDPDGKLLFSENGSGTRVEAIYRFLCILSRQLEETDSYNYIINNYHLHVTQDASDMQTQLIAFFMEFPEHTRTIRLLKCIQQEIIVAPVMELRKRIYDLYRYKDEPQSWRVQIEFGEKNIKVIHKKKERSHIDEPSQYFGFEWSMGFNFSKKLSVLNIQVQILDWYFKPEIRPEIKYTLEKAFKWFTSPSTPFRRIWIKPMQTATFWEEFPRIAENIQVVLHNSLQPGGAKSIYQYDAANRTTSIVRLLLSLTRLFEPENEEFVRKIESVFKAPTEQLTDRLMALFSGVEPGVEESPTIRVLKCLQTSLRTEVATIVNAAFADKYGLSEASASPKVTMSIAVTKNEVTKQLNRAINVTHKIRLQTREGAPESDFMLDLQLSMNLTYNYNRIEGSILVTDWSFNDKMPVEKKEAIKDLLRPFIPADLHFKRIWNKSILKLPVHAYLPKVIGNVNVMIAEQTVFVGNPNDPPANSTYELLITLGHLFDPAAVQQLKVNQNFVLKSVGDFGDKLQKLLTTFDSNSKLIRLLKCFPLNCLVPSILSLRDQIYDRFRFKEIKGQWTITVKLTGAHVLVIHKRREQAHDDTPQNYFEFAWETEFAFDRELSDFKVQTRIVDWSFAQLVQSEFKQKFVEAIKPFVPKHIYYKRIWQRPVEMFEIGLNMARIYRRTQIFDHESKLLYTHDPTKPSTEGMKDFLTTLALYTESLDCAEKVAVEFANYVNGTKDNPTSVEEFFLKGIARCGLNNNSKFMKLLKALTMEIIGPAINHFKSTYYAEFPFKDVKGSWVTELYLEPPQNGKHTFAFTDGIGTEQENRLYSSGSTDVEYDGAKIIHKKREETYQTSNEESYFTFEWQLVMICTRALDDLSVDLRITDISLFAAKNERKVNVQQAFKSLVRDNSKVFQKVTKMNVQDVVDVAISTVKKLSVTDMPKIDHPHIAEGVNLLSLLESLRRALNHVEVEMPKVILPTNRPSFELVEAAGMSRKNTNNAPAPIRSAVNSTNLGNVKSGVINTGMAPRAEPLIGSTQARRSSHKKSNSLVDITPLMPTPVTPVAPSTPGGISWTNRPAATPAGAPKGFTLRNPSNLTQNRQLPPIPITAPSSPPSGNIYLVQRPNVMNTPVAVANNKPVGTVDTAKKVSNAGVSINYSSSMPNNNSAVNTSYGTDSMLERKSSGSHIPAPPEIVALNNTQIVNNNIQKFNAISNNSPRGTTTVATTSNIYPSSSVSSPAMSIPNSPTKLSQSADIEANNSPWSSSHSQAQSNPKFGLGMTRGTPNGSASNTPTTPNNSYLRNYFN